MYEGQPLKVSNMADKKERYCWIRPELADNGIIIKFEEKVENPMEKGDYNPDRYRYEDRTRVFQVDENTTMEQALDQGLDFLKSLYKANMGMSSEES